MIRGKKANSIEWNLIFRWQKMFVCESECTCISYAVFNWSIFRIFSSYTHVYIFQFRSSWENDGERTSHPNNVEWNAHYRFSDGRVRCWSVMRLCVLVLFVHAWCCWWSATCFHRVFFFQRLNGERDLKSSQNSKKTYTQCENRGTQ